jgi:hypothetical protein
MTETGGGVSTPEPDGHSALVESDQHRGSPVFDPAGTRIGTICRVFVEASSQRLAYAEVTFGGFLGFGTGQYVTAWNKLRPGANRRGAFALTQRRWTRSNAPLCRVSPDCVNSYRATLFPALNAQP